MEMNEFVVKMLSYIDIYIFIDVSSFLLYKKFIRPYSFSLLLKCCVNMVSWFGGRDDYKVLILPFEFVKKTNFDALRFIFAPALFVTLLHCVSCEVSTAKHVEGRLSSRWSHLTKLVRSVTSSQL